MSRVILTVVYFLYLVMNDHLVTHPMVIYIGVHIGGTERGKNALTGTHRG